ncbi:MAG: ester cyclase [Solirubrobacterales bacterium]|nr:ester cyclase [Solirubrobacterales bacterium]
MSALTTHDEEKQMPETKAQTKVVDEAKIRDVFARFDSRESFFADPEARWIDRPHYRVFAQNLEMRTRDEVVAWFRGLFDAVPDLHMDVEEVVVAGEPGRERATVRWRITGTFSGSPYMGIEPTGRPVDIRGMDLLSFEDGRVAGNNIYYDQLTFARQIGMLPSEGSVGDKAITGAFNLVTKGRAAIRERSAH